MRDFLQAIVFIGVFLVLFIPLFVSESMFFPFITGKNFAFRIIVEIVFASWALLALLDATYRPRFSWILPAGSALLVVMFFANLNSAYPVKSFWSNFERMDGYVTLVHFFLYFVVLAHTLRSSKQWVYFLHTSVAIAAFVALYGLRQTVAALGGESGRIDSTLGNAAYMAIYMYFHIFFVFLLSLKTRTWALRGLYALLAVFFAYVLLETGTRGTFLGLVAGLSVSVVYMSIFARAYPEVRKVAVGALAVLVLAAGGFIALRDSAFVQDNASLRRIANIDLSTDLEVRTTIWGMAWEGVKERPLLGWGQGSFNYVFNKQYDPSLYAQEQWFDRVHNIVFDWLIAGGILGFLAYFSVLGAILYYLVWRPFFHHDANNEDASFSVLERAVLIGLVAGYFVHNLVVFDNLVSYMFYAVVLAFIHNRVSTPWSLMERVKVSSDVVISVVTPVMFAAVALLIYFVHVPNILAAQDIINAFRTNVPEERFGYFEKAIDRGTFARQEVVEQLAQQSISLAQQSQISNETKEKYLRQSEQEIKDMIAAKPNDARLHVFFAGFYRSIGQYELSKEQLGIARALSPRKQSIILEQGVNERLLGNKDAGYEYYKEAFELDETNVQARVRYAGAAIEHDGVDAVRALVGDEYFKEFALDDLALASANQAGATELLVDMFNVRINEDPTNAQTRASLAYVYYKAGEFDKAIDVLQTAGELIPDFKPVASCYVGALEKGADPATECK